MYMKSENSEIEVFICPDHADDYPVTTAQEKSKNSPMRPSVPQLGKFPNKYSILGCL